jgi:signal transduction histidine kinase
MTNTSMPRLLDAVVGIARDLSMPDLLRRIVRSSSDLAQARYAALGVLGADHTLSDLVEFSEPGMVGDWIGRPSTEDGIADALTELLLGEPYPYRDTPFPRPSLRVPVRVRGQVFATLYLTDRHGDEGFTKQDQDVVVALAAAAGVAIENATLFDQVQRRERWLEGSYQVTSALLAGQDLNTTLRLIADRGRAVSGGSAGAVARPRAEDPTQLVFEVVEPPGEDSDRLTGLAVPLEGTATGVAFTSGQPVVVRQYGELVTEQQRDTAAGTLPPMVKDLDSAIAVPLVVGDETLGVMLIAKFRDKVPFTDTEVQLAQTFAAHAALAVAFARAEDDRRRLAMFEDRDRIARDLHDLVIQRLFATGLGLEGLSRLIADAKIAERLTGFANDLDRTIRDVRNSIFSLQEPVDARGDLRSELLHIAHDAAGTLGFEPRIGFDGPVDSAVPDAVRKDLIATLREALSNTARHARATTVSVDVSVDRAGRGVSLVVVDDGIGIPAEPTRRSGLDNLGERAAHWGGVFSARRGAERGSELTWTVPLGDTRGSSRLIGENRQ